jgi:hypothetical protein
MFPPFLVTAAISRGTKYFARLLQKLLGLPSLKAVYFGRSLPVFARLCHMPHSFVQGFQLAEVFREGFALLEVRCVLVTQILALFVEPHRRNYCADTSPPELFF